MSRLVPRFETTAALVQATNEVRERVVRALAEYLDLSARMREFEDTFSAQVLQAAQQLHEIIEQRKRLEAECERIRSRIDRGGYDSAEEVEDDVRAVLTDHADQSDVTSSTAFPDAEEEEPGEADDGLDEATRKRIIRDFKRIVLPAVHADTSDTSFSAFEAAHSAYKARDHVVMEAFVIRYRGEIAASDEDGRAVSQDEAAASLSEYRAGAQRLDERLRAVRQHITDGELNAPEHTRLRMEQRNEQIRQAIDEEAELLIELRRRLQALVNSARNEYGTGIDDE